MVTAEHPPMIPCDAECPNWLEPPECPSVHTEVSGEPALCLLQMERAAGAPLRLITVSDTVNMMKCPSMEFNLIHQMKLEQLIFKV